MMKTPLYMGRPHDVCTEASSVDIHGEDAVNLHMKNLLQVRALTTANELPNLKDFMQNLMQ